MGSIPAFDELVELADKDPDAFERFRQQTCQQFIETTPNAQQRRLKAVQNRVEMALERAKTPMAGLLCVSSMMHDSFCQLASRLEQVNNIAQGRPCQAPLAPQHSAEIINFLDWKGQPTPPDRPNH